VLRASWTGYLRLSLITIPVRLFNAISSADKIALNQLHKGCNSRLKQKMVCPTHGEVEREQIVKGYEYENDNYVVIEDSDLKAIRLETTKIIDVVSFANASQLDLLGLPWLRKDFAYCVRRCASWLGSLLAALCSPGESTSSLWEFRKKVSD
jgi:Ku protein